jgi:hypothetical protein
MVEDKKELEKIAGVGHTIEIQGKKLKVSPLRLRDMIALSQYEADDHIPIESRGYSVFLHLRENPDITLESVLDMELSDITKIIEFCDAVLYGVTPEKKDDDSKNE